MEANCNWKASDIALDFKEIGLCENLIEIQEALRDRKYRKV